MDWEAARSVSDGATRARRSIHARGGASGAEVGPLGSLGTASLPTEAGSQTQRANIPCLRASTVLRQPLPIVSDRAPRSDVRAPCTSSELRHTGYDLPRHGSEHAVPRPSTRGVSGRSVDVELRSRRSEEAQRVTEDEEEHWKFARGARKLFTAPRGN